MTSKIQKLYDRATGRWINIQEMTLVVGCDGAGRAAILSFIAQPDVERKEDQGVWYRVKEDDTNGSNGSANGATLRR